MYAEKGGWRFPLSVLSRPVMQKKEVNSLKGNGRVTDSLLVVISVVSCKSEPIERKWAGHVATHSIALAQEFRHLVFLILLGAHLLKKNPKGTIYKCIV